MVAVKSLKNAFDKKNAIDPSGLVDFKRRRNIWFFSQGITFQSKGYVAHTVGLFLINIFSHFLYHLSLLLLTWARG